jgi:hypothetical protein
MRDPFAARNFPSEEVPDEESILYVDIETCDHWDLSSHGTVSLVGFKDFPPPERPDAFAYGGQAAVWKAAQLLYFGGLQAGKTEAMRRATGCPLARDFNLSSDYGAGLAELHARRRAMLVIGESHRVKEPRVPVWRDGVEVGSIPRMSPAPQGNAYNFRLAVTDPRDPYAGTYDNLCLQWETRTQDGGWTYERGLDATGVDVHLLERIPGWQGSSSLVSQTG